jgi:CRISPR-associated protein Cmr4
MTMKSIILGLLAETAIHPGSGQSSGAIDLPVAREAATDYPVIPGSSLKGALADIARAMELDKTDHYFRIFGKTDNAGDLLVSDARLLLLPVRSLSSAYKWVTCPHLIERWQRDAKRAESLSIAPVHLPVIERGQFLGCEGRNLFLEEFQFQPVNNGAEGVVRELSKNLFSLIAHEDTRKRLNKQLVVLHDDDFAWFARNGLGVQARNVLDETTKTSKNLWYEEFVPADALFYAVLAERGTDALAPIVKLLAARPYLQVGGNETVGMGWFAMALPPKQEGGTS